MQCQPCREQGQYASAELWCDECEEALCNSCKSLHMSFKVSRYHNVSKLPPLAVEEPSSGTENEVVDVGKNMWAMCDEHHDKSLEYFCIKHKKPCCILCKRQYHIDCCDVEKVDDVADDTKLATTIVDLLLGIEERKSRLTKVVDNERSNLKGLEIIKDSCIEELKNTRSAINKHLDLLQNVIEQEINKEYGNETREINKRITSLTARQKYVTNQHKIIVNTKQSDMSLGQKYLKIIRLKHMEDGYPESDETYPVCSLQGIANYKLSYEKTSDSITVERILRTFQGKDSGMLKYQGDKIEDGLESGSSIIELEPNHSKDSYFEFYPSVLELPLTSSVEGTKSSVPMTCTTTLPVELPHTSAVTCSSSFPVTHTTHISCKASTADGSLFEFYLMKSFFVEKNNKNISINDAKWMPNKDDIAIVEKSNPRCMIYRRNGQKRGQIKLIGVPQCIAIIDDNCVGLTLMCKQKVCVIDTDRWQILNTILVYDYCEGLVFYENNLIANCGNKGLTYINSSGKIVKHNIDIKGELYFHIDNKGNLYSAKMKDESIHVYNLRNNKRFIYNFIGVNNPTGLTTDRDNNLFVACHNNDTIFVKPSIHSHSSVVLGRSDGIDRPWSIDYYHENDELLVVNNAAHSIFIFRKRRKVCYAK
ncbi:uncharacterized protein LOC127714744 [Mytilus californianus]|uniref:uncharacterized protein LOC127714744 n=1 Tax=Mytilus californianus TaxID=6549 RepID=UPI002245180D|nr:uncharacterized protein LOC127714744 [Mytilus californianus]